jgi:hypothetical protein
MRGRDVTIWLSTAAVGALVAWGLLAGRVSSLVPVDSPRSAEASPPVSGLDAVPPRTQPEIPFEATERDWEIVQETVRRIRDQGPADRPMGDLVVAVGLSFVGTPYEPGTLELPGPERLAVNLRTLDCVTFVENALVLAHLVRTASDALVDDRDALARAYRERLALLRYREGVPEGYASRLHYFSEWLARNDQRGVLQVVTPSLPGAREDARPLTFMSDHPDAYRQVAEDPAVLESIRTLELGLTAPRWYIPQDQVEQAAAGGNDPGDAGIRNGDIIAAKSILEGLDVAHTGIAVWQGGELHLLHAPLVGDSVEVSPRPLGERLRGIRAQDGILVARPVEP